MFKEVCVVAEHNVLVDIHNEVSVQINQGAVAAAFSVADKAVDNHIVLDGRNAADAD